MNMRKRFGKTFVLSLAVVALLWAFPSKTYAVGVKGAASSENSNTTSSQKEKQGKEYAQQKIKKVNNAYFYKKKSVRLLIDDTGEKAETNTFYYNKKGEVDIRIVRNQKGKIMGVKSISKKKAKKMLKKYSVSYCFN